MIILYHKDIAAVSYNGTQYNADGYGMIEVPDEAAPKLIADFNFIIAGDGTDKEPSSVKTAKPIATWSNDELKEKADELNIDVKDMKRNDLLKAVSAAMKAGLTAQQSNNDSANNDSEDDE